MQYVVYKTTYTGTKLPPYYIGSTNRHKAMSGKYFGTIKSKKWKDIFNNELKNNLKLFSIEILSYHETRKDALVEELRLHKLYNVVKSDNYYNESLASVNGYFGRSMAGENNPMYGRSQFDLLIEKYGINEAKERWDAISKNKSNAFLKSYASGNRKTKTGQTWNKGLKGFGKFNSGKTRTKEQKIRIGKSHIGNTNRRGDNYFLNKDELFRLYVIDKLNISKICKKFNVGSRIVKRNIEEHGIKR